MICMSAGFIYCCLILFIFPDAISNAAYLCEQFYCAAPEVEISEFNGKLSLFTLTFVIVGLWTFWGWLDFGQNTLGLCTVL